MQDMRCWAMSASYIVKRITYSKLILFEKQRLDVSSYSFMRIANCVFWTVRGWTNTSGNVQATVGIAII